MDDKIKSTIEKVVKLASQNPEFGAELRKRLGIASLASVVSVDDRKLDEIYEYCIEKVVKKQAKEFYADFPLPAIRDALIDDFCRMESFRRKDNFGDFCLALYQQIERMTNVICTNPALTTIAEKMMQCCAYVKSGKTITPSIENRAEGEFTVAGLLFPGQNKQTGLPYSVEKPKKTLQSHYAIDKMRIVVYFLGYKGLMKTGDYDAYTEFTSVLKDLYQCRNTNHRGNNLFPWEQEVIDRIIPHKGIYYLKFLGALTEYVDCIKTGYPEIPTMLAFVQSGQVKPVSGIKIKGKIDLPEDGKKRFR